MGILDKINPFSVAKDAISEVGGIIKEAVVDKDKQNEIILKLEELKIKMEEKKLEFIVQYEGSFAILPKPLQYMRAGYRILMLYFFFLLMIVAVFYPAAVIRMFEAMQKIPDWLGYTFAGMNTIYFGQRGIEYGMKAWGNKKNESS